ncbi:MAG: nucleoside triphosphate pyrophosphohydrolase [Chloroflexi bacterium]|nr:nucleoside triphosphate pyrophosphohydrolase [Chloroflexota bacterium]
MTRHYYHKLVRDRIPEIIEEAGGRCETGTYANADYARALLDKLIEEATEARRAAHPDDLVTELADVFEVLDALLAAHNITPEQVMFRKVARRHERGGFEARTQLLWSEPGADGGE